MIFNIMYISLVLTYSEDNTQKILIFMLFFNMEID